MWYFLPKEIIPDGADEAFARVGVSAIQHVVVFDGVQREGLAFYAENLITVLEALGFRNTRFESLPLGEDQLQVKFLKPTGKASDEGTVPKKVPELDIQGFVDAYLLAARQGRERLAEDRALLSVKLDTLTRDLASTAAQLETVELQMSTLVMIEDDVVERLRKDLEKIKADSRLQRVGYTDKRIVLETKEIVINTGERSYRIGRLRVFVSVFDGQILVETLDSIGPSAHPLVSIDGVPQLGNLRDAIVRYIGKRELFNVAKIMLDFLTRPPRQTLEGLSIDQWPEIAPVATT